MIYTHVLNRGPAAVRSPLDTLTARAPGAARHVIVTAALAYPAGARSVRRTDRRHRK
jgi:hypothetical protein